jgi:regulator of nonsense transcripts 2
MKTHQAAEREEQQRIKSLVLNYDLRDGEEQQDGDFALPLLPNPNIHAGNAGIEKAAPSHARSDKPARSGQRARKLQLSDVTDWYARPENKPHVSHVENLSLSVPQTSPKRALSTPPPVSPKKWPETQANKPRPRTTGRGRLTRREIAQEHAARKAATQTE